MRLIPGLVCLFGISLLLGCGSTAPKAQKKPPAKKAVAAASKKLQAKPAKAVVQQPDKKPPPSLPDEGTKFPLPPAVDEPAKEAQPPSEPQTKSPPSEAETKPPPKAAEPPTSPPPPPPYDPANPTPADNVRAYATIKLPGEVELTPENRANLAFISDDFIGAIFIRPQPILKSKYLADSVVTKIAAAGSSLYGLKGDSLKEIVVLYPEPAAQQRQPLALIVRLSEPPADLDKVLTSSGNKVQLKEEGDLRYGEDAAGRACLAADKTTLLYGTKSAVLKMAAAKDVKSPLTDLLAKADVGKDITGIFVITDALRNHFRQEAKRLEDTGEQKYAPWLIAGNKALADGGKFAIFSFTFSGDPIFSGAIELGSEAQAASMRDDLIVRLDQMYLQYRQAPFEFLPGAPDEVNRVITQFLNGLSRQFRVGAQRNSTIGFVFPPPNHVADRMKAAINRQLASSTPEGQLVGRMNDLKQFGIGFHTHLDLWRSWPISKSGPKEWFDKEGKPLLSWRVHTLPQMEQQLLYDKFHLNEPWDSPHNLKLAEQIPPYLKRPGLGLKTPLLLYTGPGTFQEGKGASMDCTDGFENTILVVEAGDDKAVFWTKPEDLVFNPKDPLAALGTLKDDFILATMADGKTLKLRKDTPAEKFAAMITRSGGEKVNCLDFALDVR